MRTRHRIDTSTRFDRNAVHPPERLIERAGVDPDPQLEPPTEAVPREPYLAGPELEDAVNLAIALGRPLLLQGDPGAGKSRLANAVAYALGLPLEEAYVKSTSRATDLLYVYDAVTRLYDAQAPVQGRSEATAREPRHYITLGPLGRAIARAGHGRRSVVLIDEIDKADLDFPNDLLRELDRLAFDVPEVPRLGFAVPDDRPELRPIIIITNNEEKTLPAAFLRRCIYHFVEFPDDRERIAQILELHEVQASKLREQAVDVLLRLREIDLMKRPGLSELLDWVGYLQAVQGDPGDLASLPYGGALLKNRGDLARAAERLIAT